MPSAIFGRFFDGSMILEWNASWLARFGRYKDYRFNGFVMDNSSMIPCEMEDGYRRYSSGGG